MNICNAFAFFSIPLILGVVLAGCAGASPRFTSQHSPVAPALVTDLAVAPQLNGIASYYADEFHGRKTANGEKYDMHELTAAHRTLPFNTRLRVRNLENELSVVVRVNDRGPFKDDRVIDLSLEAAKQVGLISSGTARVELEILEMGNGAK